MLTKRAVYRRNVLPTYRTSKLLQYQVVNYRSNSPKLELTYLTYEKALFIAGHCFYYCN